MDVASFYRNVFQKSMVILLNRPSLEFIGILSYGVQIKIASIEEYIGKVSIPSLAFTDGESITIMAADELSPKQVAFIIFHEIWHILNFHPSRCGTRDPVLWNLCVDHVTNRVGKEYSDKGVIELTKGMIFWEDIHSKHPEISSEDLYNLKLKDWDDYKVEIFQVSGDSDENQQNNPGDSDNKCPNCGKDLDEEPQDKSDGEQDDKGDSKDGSVSPVPPDETGSTPASGNSDQSCPHCNAPVPSNQPEEAKGSPGQSQGVQHPSQGSLAGKKFAKVTNKKTGKSEYVPLDCDTKPENSDKVKEKCQKMAMQGRLLWNSNSVSKGDMPGSMVQILDELLKIELPWDEIVERALLYHAPNMTRRTWSARDPYIRSQYLPGKLNGSDTELAVFVIDTSGSVDDKDLKKFIGICCDSANYFSKLVVLMHDHDLKKPEHWFDNRPDETQVFDQIKNIMGRGGTSHKDVFDRLEELHETELVSVVTFLTDYESDIEHIYKKYEWIKEVPTIWVLNSNHTVKLDEEYEFKQITIN